MKVVSVSLFCAGSDRPLCQNKETVIKIRIKAMTATLDARNLSLKDVHRLLKLERQLNNSLSSLLSLEPLTELEQQNLDNFRNNFYEYYSEDKISEGQVKFLTLAPLMWLSGFYQPRIRISLEERIADIEIQDEDTIIKGRMDILAVSRAAVQETAPNFWILLIETKNSTVDAMEGLPQLLTYAYTSLEHQTSVWGLTTNGMDYQFVYIEPGNSPNYQLFPKLNLIYPESSIQLLQVLKAICKIAVSPNP